MKIVKTVLFLIWGLLTFGFFILAFVERRDMLNFQDEAIKIQSKLLNNSNEIVEEYKSNMELLRNKYLNNNTIDSIIQNSKFLQSLASERIAFEIKDNPKVFLPNEKYWIKLKAENINKEKIAITSNNGKIFKSELKGYDFMFIPKKNGKLKLEIYDREKNYRLCGKIDINVTNNIMQ